jgi:general secretion pathway protein A
MDLALAGLMKLWNASYAAGGTAGCLQAQAQGLECVRLRSSLAQLRELRRPAILLLEEYGGASYQVLLTGIAAQSVQLQLGARTAIVTIAELSRYWFGDCLLLWRPLSSPVTELHPGMDGPAVRTLRVQLLQASGAPASGASSVGFDAGLTALVEDFQRKHHLAVDGIAGVETQLLLDAVLAAPDTPLLQLRAG